MKNVFIQKLKNVLLFILKSIVFLFICINLLYIFVYIAMFVTIIYACFFKVIGIELNMSLWYLTGITTQILQIIVFYFISKKLGIIETFDKLPYWALLPIAFIYEIIILYYTAIGGHWLLGSDDKIYYYIETMAYTSFHGSSYLYTFLTYSIIRLLNKKYPKALNKFLKKKN